MPPKSLMLLSLGGLRRTASLKVAVLFKVVSTQGLPEALQLVVLLFALLMAYVSLAVTKPQIPR